MAKTIERRVVKMGTSTDADVESKSDPTQDNAPKRNPGMPLDLSWVNSVRINANGVMARAAEFGTRRSVKKEWQTAWLMRAVNLIDLTTLDGGDTEDRVERLCSKAQRAVNPTILDKLGLSDAYNRTAAVCVYHDKIPAALETLEGTGIPIAAVSTSFPDGQGSLETRLAEIRSSVAAGANEIDIVLKRDLVLNGKWEELYAEVKAMREACGDAKMKTILGTGNLGEFKNIAKASLVCMMAGADFIKTSTGKEKLNATLPISLVMMRMIRDYHEQTGYKVGYKPAGGISKAKDALTYLMMVEDELGMEWIDPNLFRFGASSLLNDLERQLDHRATGQYSAGYRHAMS